MTARSRVIVVLVALVATLFVSAMNLDVRIWRDHPRPFGCAPTSQRSC